MALQLLGGTQEIAVRDKDLPNIDDGDPDTVYYLRAIPALKQREIREAHKRSTRTGPEFDEDGIVDDMLDFALVRWDGVLYDGAPAPCSREMKLGGLDRLRKRELIAIAGMNRITRSEVREAGFREPA